MSMAGQESEWLEMSQRDRDRLKVLHGVIRKERLQKEAARLLRLSVRQVRRLVGRLKESGDRGLIHRRQRQIMRFSHIRIAFGFLTVLPLGTSGVSLAEVGRAGRWFPLVGLVLGALLAVMNNVVALALPTTGSSRTSHRRVGDPYRNAPS